MADATHKTYFQGDSSSIEKAAKRASTSIDNLTKSNSIMARQVLESKRSWESYTTAVTRNGKEINRLQGVLRNSAGAMGKFGAANARAVPAMQEFSRVIQDAPYGIQGVANNVQQLTAQFGYLSAQSGGGTKALKEMVLSLWGPAGILLAVSAVTAAFIKYEDEIKEFITGQENAAKAAGRFSDELKEQAGALDNVSSRLDKGIGRAVKALRSRLEAEGKSGQEIASEVEKWSKVQIETRRNAVRARQALEDEAFKEYKKLSNEFYGTKDDKEKEALKTAKANLDKAKEATVKSQESLNEAVLALDAAKNSAIADDLKEGTKKLEDELKKRLKANTEYYNAVLKLQSEIRGRTSGTKGFFDSATTKSDKGDIVGSGVDTDNFLGDPSIQGLLAGLSPERIEGIREAFRNLGKTLQQEGEDVINIGGAIANGIASFGLRIADAISSGTLSIATAGNALLETFGNFMVNFGQQLIAWGTAKIALDSLAISGAAAVAAGTALVIAGRALSTQASKNLSSIMNGGSASYGGGGSSSFSGSTAQAASVNTGGRYVFEIEGTKLVGVLSNTLARNRALGTDLNF